MTRITYFDGHRLEVELTFRIPPGPNLDVIWERRNQYGSNDFEPANGVMQDGSINLVMSPYNLTTDTVNVLIDHKVKPQWTLSTLPIESQLAVRGATFKLPNPVVTPYAIDVGDNNYRLGFRWISKIDRNLYTVRGFLQGWSAHSERWEDVEDFTFDDASYEHRMFVSPYGNGVASGQPSAQTYRLHVKAYFRNRTPVVSENATFISEYAKPVWNRSYQYERFDRHFKMNLLGLRQTFQDEMLKDNPLRRTFFEELALDNQDFEAIEGYEVGDEMVVGDPFIDWDGEIYDIRSVIPYVGEIHEKYVEGFHQRSGGENPIEDYKMAGMSNAEVGAATMGQMLGYIAAVPRIGAQTHLKHAGEGMIRAAERGDIPGQALELLTFGWHTPTEGGGDNITDATHMIGRGVSGMGDWLDSYAASNMIATAALGWGAGRALGLNSKAKAAGQFGLRQATKHADVPDEVGVPDSLPDIMNSAADGVNSEPSVRDELLSDDKMAEMVENIQAIRSNIKAAKEGGMASLIGWLFPEDTALKLMQAMNLMYVDEVHEDGDTSG